MEDNTVPTFTPLFPDEKKSEPPKKKYPNLTGRKKGQLDKTKREPRDDFAKKRAAIHAADEKIRRDLANKEASELAQYRPIPEMPIQAVVEKQREYIRESIERVIVLASVDGIEKSRLDALYDKAYMLAMDSSADLEIVLKTIKLLGEQLQGKGSNADGGSSGVSLTVNVNATRFQVKETPTPTEGVIDVE